MLMFEIDPVLTPVLSPRRTSGARYTGIAGTVDGEAATYIRAHAELRRLKADLEERGMTPPPRYEARMHERAI
jgi:hypothetical protein